MDRAKETDRHYSPEQVRGGSEENVVRWVLAISFVLIVLAMSAVWIVGAVTR
ncbi:hypothetical protein [Sphingomonas ginkgonis]|uniref:hypothetical protein n=1 Tax=Sphingomonas ginkgonis TaxID=2315330 RepID=UPI00163A851D|nr:hypothetical protein [Sphingomonas ginkgonis]